MTVDRYIRLIAGALVILTVALGYWVHPYWYVATVLLGINLVQSALTNWCPLTAVLRKMDIRDPQ